ncbi:MAG: hypothetical protein OJF52_000967 [Nitrospira sp.]|nr:MAG: hypothetical protein OJF52_000967 [Nitrospira sp.]
MKPIQEHRRAVSPWTVRAIFMIIGLSIATGCASPPLAPKKTIHQSGLNTVWLEPDPDSTSNTHPISLTPTEVGTLLRGVRSWERRNVLHRLFAGQADKTRTFRDEEIAILAPSLSKALAQASPSERIYFHLSHPTEQGNEETTTGWISVRGPLVYLSLSEAHDQHSPGPDISKYDRQMPNVPEVSPEFDVTFEPEEFLAKVSSIGRLFAPDQREELQIRYREALSSMPIQPGLERGGERPLPQP